MPVIALSSPSTMETNDKESKDEETYAIASSKKTHICEYCGNDFSKRSSLEQHYAEHPHERPHECGVCLRRFEMFHELVDHSLIHINKTSFTCKICNISFEKKRLYVSHFLTHKDKPHLCDICKQSFARVDQLVEHDCPSEGPTTSCNVCFKEFGQKSDLTQHLLSHSGDIVYQCKLCDSRFGVKTDFLKHELTHTGSVVCNICLKVFATKPLLEEHKLCHKSSTNLKCDHCDRRFATKKLLSNHVSSHKFSCHLCNKVFKSEKRLQIHNQQVHQDGESKSCKACFKCFLSKNDLLSHKCSSKYPSSEPDVKARENVSSFDNLSCELCGENFENADLLESHLLEHDQKPFVCVDCCLVFAKSSDYEEHMLSHPERAANSNVVCISQNSILCSVCNRSFSSKNALIKHCKEKSHGDLFNCDACAETFCSEMDFLNHCLKHKEDHRFNCSECSETFSLKEDLLKHEEQHKTSDTFFCDECHRVFFSETDALTHKCSQVSENRRAQTDSDQSQPRASLPSSHQRSYECNVCKKGFDTENELINHCLNPSVEAPLVCNVCEEKFCIESDFSNHLLSHNDGGSYLCDLCDNIFSEEIDFLNHCLNHPPESQKCKFCGSAFHKLGDLNQHLLSHSGDGENPEAKSSQVSRDLVSCSGCHKSFDKNDFADHGCGKLKYQCEKCNLKFKDQNAMMQHFLTECKSLVNLCDPGAELQADLRQQIEESLDHQRHFCKICKAQFSSEQSLRQHRLSHLKKAFTCDLCNEKFVLRNDLVIHRLAHSVKEPHVCSLCSECFPREQDLMKHRVSEHSVRVLYKCDVCGESYPNKYDVINHRRKHVLGGPHTCGVCKEKFPKRADLLNHYPVHQTEGKFFCSVCSSSFLTKNDLEAHNLSHSFDRPYVCEVCKMRFRHQRDLKSHRLVHSLDKPFACDLCDKTFRRKDLLSVHQSTHSLDSLFSCKICLKSFTTKTKLEKHELSHIHYCHLCNKTFLRRDLLKRHLIMHSSSSTKTNGIKELAGKKSLTDFYNELMSDTSSVDKAFSNISPPKIINQANGEECSTANESGTVSELFSENGFANSSENSDVLNVNAENLSMATIEVSNENFMEVVDALNTTEFAKKLTKNPKRRAVKSQNATANQIINKLTSIDPNLIDLQNITYNPETNEFEISIDTVENKSHLLALDNAKTEFIAEPLSQEAIGLCNGTLQLKTECKDKVDVETANSGVNFQVEGGNNGSESNIILNTENGKFEVCTDISNLITVMCNDGSNPSTNNVESMEVSNENIPNSSQVCIEICNMEVVDAQNDSQERQDIANAVSSIQDMEANDNSLEAICENVAQNTDALFQKHSVELTNESFSKNIIYVDDIALQGENEANNGVCVVDPQFSLVSRLRTSRLLAKKYICDFCKKGFVTKNLLERHRFSHTGEKPYQCTLCDKRFSRKDYLEEHLLTHSGNKPHKCHICSRSFHRKNHLEKHIQTHSTEKPYACEVCGKCFTRKDYLVGHRLIHDVANPYMCDLCDETFRVKAELDAHKVCHTVEITYICGLCNKCFPQKRLLQRHFYSHTGEKPYECSVCNKKFSRKDSLNTHHLMHSGERPHVCHLCKKSFFQKYNLVRHMRIHSDEKTTSKSSKKRERHQTTEKDSLSHVGVAQLSESDGQQETVVLLEREVVL